MRSTRMRPGQEPDDYLYYMDSYRDFGLTDIRRMMAGIYTDNSSRSELSKGNAGRGAAMQAVDQDRTSVLCHYCDQFGHFKRKCPLRIKHQQQHRQQPVWLHQQQQHGQRQQKPRGRRQNNGGDGGGRVWCSYQRTTSHNDADCRVQQHKAGGNAHVAAALTQRVKGVCSADDLPEEDDEPERPYISLTATEVQSKTEQVAAPRHKNGTWPFSLLKPSYDFSDDTARRQLRLARRHAAGRAELHSALDFGVDTPAGTV